MQEEGFGKIEQLPQQFNHCSTPHRELEIWIHFPESQQHNLPVH